MPPHAVYFASWILEKVCSASCGPKSAVSIQNKPKQTLFRLKPTLNPKPRPQIPHPRM